MAHLQGCDRWRDARLRAGAGHGTLTACPRSTWRYRGARLSKRSLEVLVLNEGEVTDLLDLRELLGALGEGFRALSAGELIAPERNGIAMPRIVPAQHAGRAAGRSHDGAFNWMPPVRVTGTTRSRSASAVAWMIEEATQATGRRR
jgi:hypothetical protein